VRIVFDPECLWQHSIQWGDPMIPLESVFGDLRYGLRQLCRKLGLTMAAVLVLGLGIGVNTAVFTLYKAFVTRRLGK
jgi:hypothetical protein